MAQKNKKILLKNYPFLLSLDKDKYSARELVNHFEGKIGIDLSRPVPPKSSQSKRKDGKPSKPASLRSRIRTIIDRKIDQLDLVPLNDAKQYSRDDCERVLHNSKEKIDEVIGRAKEKRKLDDLKERQAIGRAYAEENYIIEEEYYFGGQHDDFIEEMQAHEWAESIAGLLHELERSHLHGLTITGGKKLYDSETGKVLGYEEVRQRVDSYIENSKNPALLRSALEEAEYSRDSISSSELEKMWQDYLSGLVKEYVLEQMNLDIENLRKAWENRVNYLHHRNILDEPNDETSYDMKMLEDPLKNFKR